MRRQSFTTKARAHHRLIDDGSEYRVPRWSCFPEGEPPTYEELLEADIRRKRLLSMARNLSPFRFGWLDAGLGRLGLGVPSVLKKLEFFGTMLLKRWYLLR